MEGVEAASPAVSTGIGTRASAPSPEFAKPTLRQRLAEMGRDTSSNNIWKPEMHALPMRPSKPTTDAKANETAKRRRSDSDDDHDLEDENQKRRRVEKAATARGELVKTSDYQKAGVSKPTPRARASTAAAPTKPKTSSASNAPHPAAMKGVFRTSVSESMISVRDGAQDSIAREKFLTPIVKTNLETILTDGYVGRDHISDRWARQYVRMVENGVGEKDRLEWAYETLLRGKNKEIAKFWKEVKDCFFNEV